MTISLKHLGLWAAMAAGLTLLPAQAATLTHQDTAYTVTDEVLAQYPQLVDLLLNSASMSPAQKQRYFDGLPGMSASSRERLLTILQTEKDELARLDTLFAANTPQAVPQKQLQNNKKKYRKQYRCKAKKKKSQQQCLRKGKKYRSRK